MQIQCDYCKKIAEFDRSYKIRKASIISEAYMNRCEMHWQYICDICKKSRHFSGIAWDRENDTFICIDCGTSTKLVRDKYWTYDYYFIIKNKDGKWLKALDRLEFENLHPINFNNYNNRAAIPDISKVKKKFNKREDVDIPSEGQIADFWNQNANAWNASYKEDGDTQRKYLLPFNLFDSYLENTNFILDAGCGAGYMSRHLASRGKQVVGIDNSHSQITLAKEKILEKNDRIQYFHASLTNLSLLRNFHYFDAAICTTVLENIKDYKKAISEIGKYLEPGGVFILSIIHPCFSMKDMITVRIPIDGVRIEDVKHWEINNYYLRGVSLINYSSLPAPTITFHRTLEDYCFALNSAGFYIRTMLEPCPKNNQIDLDPQLLKSRSNRIPRFLVIIAEKK